MIGYNSNHKIKPLAFDPAIVEIAQIKESTSLLKNNNNNPNLNNDNSDNTNKTSSYWNYLLPFAGFAGLASAVYYFKNRDTISIEEKRKALKDIKKDFTKINDFLDNFNAIKIDNEEDYEISRTKMGRYFKHFTNSEDQEEAISQMIKKLDTKFVSYIFNILNITDINNANKNDISETFNLVFDKIKERFESDYSIKTPNSNYLTFHQARMLKHKHSKIQEMLYNVEEELEELEEELKNENDEKKENNNNYNIIKIYNVENTESNKKRLDKLVERANNYIDKKYSIYSGIMIESNENNIWLELDDKQDVRYLLEFVKKELDEYERNNNQSNNSAILG